MRNLVKAIAVDGRCFYGCLLQWHRWYWALVLTSERGFETDCYLTGVYDILIVFYDQHDRTHVGAQHWDDGHCYIMP